MSVRIESTVVINAPREYVWMVIQDPERRIEWDERVVSVRQLTPRPIGRGTRMEIITSMYGLDFRQFWSSSAGIIPRAAR